MKPNAEDCPEQSTYEALVTLSSEPLFALDGSGTLQVVNDAFASLAGVDRGELVGRSLASLIHTADSGEWERRLEMLQNDVTTDRERWPGRLVTSNGTAVDVEWECSVVAEDVVVGSATDRRGGKQQKQRLRILNRTLRHNIRNRMNVIIAQAESLQETDDDGYRAIARQIAENSKRVVTLSDKARKAQQHLEIPDDEDCTQELVEETETVRRKFAITHPGATVETDVPGRARAVAPPSYDVALTELIENGVVHHPSGTGPVTVRIERSDSEVSVAVVDGCEPIPEEVCRTIAGGTERPLQHNDGLGLWLVRWIVEPVGASLTFDRRENGEGNVVTLTFSRADG